jgi:hypothetical protein
MMIEVYPNHRPPTIAEYGSGLSAWSHKPRIAGSNPASATKFDTWAYSSVG